MNKSEADILLLLDKEQAISQRSLAKKTGISLGLVNRALKNLKKEGYVDAENRLLEKAKAELKKNQPENAILLAAGYGMRMVPINTDISKGLLEIKGEPLIERQIKQLQAAGIQDISVVVGYMKEQYEYLIDQYGVNLIVNMDYGEKNNIVSLAKAADQIGNTYIVPCDLWARENPFSSRELYPWYMVSDTMISASPIRISRSGGFARTQPHEKGNRMLGISYISKDYAPAFVQRLKAMAQDPEYDQCFWEEAMLAGRHGMQARMVKADDVIEINTYEQLRDLDQNSNQLSSPAVDAICEAFQVAPEEITNIQVLKKGMTNRSFLFEVNADKYIMRIPGEGTDQMINRQEEGQVYQTIRNLDLCDDIAYINPENGFKITRFLENSHVCDPANWEEIGRCMEVLRHFHSLQLQVDHDFDLFGQMAFYESLRPGKSLYRDYERTRQAVLDLKPWIDSLPKDRALTHIDAVPDNFLITPDGQIRLIDWEYAGMQDPHVDLAMFCIYSFYDKEQTDRLIDLYFQGNCDGQTRLKIYAYMAIAGLLWSNWCEYKASLGLEFGEYALRQYRYAKEYSRLVKKELENAKN